MKQAVRQSKTDRSSHYSPAQSNDRHSGVAMVPPRYGLDLADGILNGPSPLSITPPGIQSRLTIGAPDDKYEQEADRAADTVMRNTDISAKGSRIEEEKNTESGLQPKPITGLMTPVINQASTRSSANVQPIFIPDQEVELQRKEEEPEEEEDPVQARFITQRLTDEEEKPVQTRSAIMRKESAGIGYVVNIDEPKQKPREVIQTKPGLFRRIYRKVTSVLSRSSESSSDNSSPSSDFESSLNSTRGGGFPMKAETRSFMETRFQADFSGVRLHTDNRAVQMSHQINAQAFTHNNDIYFNEGRYNPDTSAGKHLLAHELTHTIQQGAAVQQKSASNKIQTKDAGIRSGIQRTWYGDAWDSVSGAVGGAVDFVADNLEAGLDWIKDQFREFVQEIPGYRLLAVVLGQDPVTGATVARNGRNFIEAGLDIIPFGNLFKRKLEETGALSEAAAWLDIQIADLDVSLTGIQRDLRNFWNRLSLSDIASPREVLGRAANIIRRPVGQIVTFAGNVATEFLRIVKNYVISELISFIRNHTRGYPLLTVILEKDPISEEPVERNGMNLIRGFMLLSEEGEEQLRQMEETGSLQRAADWIDGAVERLDLTWETIRNTFAEAWNRLTIESLMRPGPTFQELVELFAEPVGRIIHFVIEVGRKILELIKNALLSRLAAYARETRGYPLITVLLGKDPFTEEPVERTPVNIIHGFMSLMEGGEEQFQQMQETGAIQRTTAWIEGAVARLGFTWDYITGLFMSAWNSFSLQDLAAPFEAFARIVRLFAAPITRLLEFIWEVIKKVVEIVLIIMKFPIDLVNNIITRAMEAIEDIKRDPVGFIKNLLRAIKMGFTKFFDNILTHLIQGLTSWLFSELEDAGVRPPQDLSLGSIFGFVLDVLGITMERIWQKLADRIGQERVDRIRGMIDRLTGIWAFVKDVMNRGPIAIWEYIVERISNLWDMVLEHVRNWVMTRIIERVTARLLSMLDPTGIMAVVNSVIALYNAIESFIRYLREMLEIVNSFVVGVAEIARGDLTRAADFLENSLARAMPVAIGFLANQVGLSGLGQRIGEMIEAVRERVDAGLDWLMDRAVSAGTAFLDMARAGVGAVRAGIANLREWWTSSERLTTADGQDHELTFSGSGRAANLVIRSVEKPYTVYLNEVKATYNLTDDQIRPAMTKASQIETEKQRSVPEDQQEEHGRNINNLVLQLAALTRDLPLSGTAGTNTDPVFGPLHQGFGTLARVVYQESPHTHGSDPTVNNTPEYDDINIRRRGRGSFYVKGHLLNENLAGPGNTWSNLTPLSQMTNDDHKRNFENPVKMAVNGVLAGYSEVKLGHMRNFMVQANYGRAVNESLIEKLVDTDDAISGLDPNADRADVAKILRAEQYVPTSLTCSAEITDRDGNTRSLNVPITNNIFYGQMSHYQLNPSPKSRYVLAEKIDFSKTDPVEASSRLTELSGIAQRRAVRIYNAFITSGRIRSYSRDVGITKKTIEDANPRYRIVSGVKP